MALVWRVRWRGRKRSAKAIARHKYQWTPRSEYASWLAQVSRCIAVAKPIKTKPNTETKTRQYASLLHKSPLPPAFCHNNSSRCLVSVIVLATWIAQLYWVAFACCLAIAINAWSFKSADWIVWATCKASENAHGSVAPCNADQAVCPYFLHRSGFLADSTYPFQF
jgi:hypothetical protein